MRDIYESRCGLKCSSCYDKEEYGCEGCLNMKEGYWGEPCEIKDCCVAKNHDHCGLCKNFPCELLLDVSYDTDLGDDGDRLMNLKLWGETHEAAKTPLYKKIIPWLVIGLIVIVTLPPWLLAAYMIIIAVFLIIHYNKK